MNRQLSSYLNRLILIALFLAAAPGVQAETINADVSENSGSRPHLNADASDWADFDTALGYLNKGGLSVQYEGIAVGFPLSFHPRTTSVRLRPGSACKLPDCECENDSEPELEDCYIDCQCIAIELTDVGCLEQLPQKLTSDNFGQCFYRRPLHNNKAIEIYYMGRFPTGEPIRYTISGLKSASSGTDVTDFDSDNILPDKPPSPSIPGRIPARLVLVLDRSGSMNWSSKPYDKGDNDIPCNRFGSPPPGCEPARWEVLSAAVNAMLSVADAYLLPGDEIAVAPFSNTVDPTEVVPRQNLDHTTITSIRHLVDRLSPSGTTSIGAGLLHFEDDVQPVPPGTRNQTVLLFTDGDQNRAPYVEVRNGRLKTNGAGYADGSGTEGDGDDSDTEKVRVCPFALRADNPGGALGTQFNNDIARARCEGVVFTTNSIDPAKPHLIEYFLEILNKTLIGDKLEIATVNSGRVEQPIVLTMTGASQDSENFVISRQDQAFTVLMAWAERGNFLRTATLVKDGVEFSLHAQSLNGQVYGDDTHAAITLREPLCNEAGECVEGAGEWTLHFTPSFKVSNTFNYSFIVTTDNATLASTYRASQPTVGVGQPLSLEVELSEAGEPLTGLPEGSITALVAGPGSGLGNLLSASDAQPVSQPEDDDVIGAAGRKAAAMLANPAQRDALLEALIAGAAQTVTLTETERGRYTGSLTDTGAEGIYQVRFLVDGETPDNGRFTRTFTLTRYVPVVPDPDATKNTVSVASIPECPLPGGCFAITLKPQDSAGNLLGPGKSPLFSVPGDVELLNIVDELNGAFTLKVGYPEGVTGNPGIDIYGVEVVPEVPGAPDGGILEWLKAYLWLMILLLLLLILILFLIRRKQSTS
jgi:hypothetical protein